MATPIIMAAFGTTSKALATYDHIDARVKKKFPGHDVYWAYSSRMVKDFIKKKKDIDLKHPHQVLAELNEKGEKWAVVQSMHLIGGHEFFRLVNEVDESDVRASVGLPLLSSPDDFTRTVKALEETIINGKEEAIVFVGHGTDHMAWSSYPALAHVLQSTYGNRVFVGVVEGGPEAEDIAEKVRSKGYRKARIVPFMLVAGVHFYEDLASDDEDSWKRIFEAKGISVVLENEGVGYNDRITDIFCDHISAALAMI